MRIRLQQLNRLKLLEAVCSHAAIAFAGSDWSMRLLMYRLAAMNWMCFACTEAGTLNKGRLFLQDQTQMCRGWINEKPMEKNISPLVGEVATCFARQFRETPRTRIGC